VVESRRGKIGFVPFFYPLTEKLCYFFSKEYALGSHVCLLSHFSVQWTVFSQKSQKEKCSSLKARNAFSQCTVEEKPLILLFHTIVSNLQNFLGE